MALCVAVPITIGCVDGCGFSVLCFMWAGLLRNISFSREAEAPGIAWYSSASWPNSSSLGVLLMCLRSIFC